MKIKRTLLILILTISSRLVAQDPVFTQFYLFPQTLNPGFTGLLEDWHVGAVHRTQWPNELRQIDNDFLFANNATGLNGGLGVTVLSSREKFTKYSLTQINGAYSYKIQLNNNWNFRPAIEVGLGRKNFNFNGLILEDQINPTTGEIMGPSSDPSLINSDINYFDFSAGFIFDTEDLWLGASLKHLNKPDISFTGEQNVPLEMFFSVHGGWEFYLFNHRMNVILPEDSKMLLSLNYMQQGEYNRLDTGTALIFNNWTFGATTTLNPFRKSDQSHLLTSVNPFVSLQIEHFIFGMSYDANLSKLSHTRGVFEFGLTYQANLDLKCFGCPTYSYR